jgi:5-carboxymethyl-2-hydroxymuconic-semialdehyde dehydrogenase
VVAAYIWTSDLQRAYRLAPAIESVATWVNSHNARDLWTSPGGAGREDGPASIDFYAQSRTVHLAADDSPVPRFGA